MGPPDPLLPRRQRISRMAVAGPIVPDPEAPGTETEPDAGQPCGLCAERHNRSHASSRRSGPTGRGAPSCGRAQGPGRSAAPSCCRPGMSAASSRVAPGTWPPSCAPPAGGRCSRSPNSTAAAWRPSPAPPPRSPRHRRAAGLATTVSARPSAAGRSMCRCYCCMSPPVPGGGPPPKPDSVPVTWKLESISTVTSVPSAFCMWPS